MKSLGVRDGAGQYHPVVSDTIDPGTQGTPFSVGKRWQQPFEGNLQWSKLDLGAR